MHEEHQQKKIEEALSIINPIHSYMKQPQEETRIRHDLRLRQNPKEILPSCSEHEQKPLDEEAI